MSTAENREVTLPLGVVIEKRRSSHPWADWIWEPVAVFLDTAAKTGPRVMIEEEARIRYHAGTLPLTLHRKETEALCLNLELDAPELYVVLEENPDHTSPLAYRPHLVTASSYQAQDYTDAGDAIVGKVAMPEAVAAFIQAFVEAHHKDEAFKKRRRDRLDPEQQKFGKAPIFTPLTRQ